MYKTRLREEAKERDKAAAEKLQSRKENDTGNGD
jgi:hypothetical protein